MPDKPDLLAIHGHLRRLGELREAIPRGTRSGLSFDLGSFRVKVSCPTRGAPECDWEATRALGMRLTYFLALAPATVDQLLHAEHEKHTLATRAFTAIHAAIETLTTALDCDPGLDEASARELVVQARARLRAALEGGSDVR